MILSAIFGALLLGFLLFTVLAHAEQIRALHRRLDDEAEWRDKWEAQIYKRFERLEAELYALGK